MLLVHFPLALLQVAQLPAQSPQQLPALERLEVTTGAPLAWLQTPAAVSYRQLDNQLPVTDHTSWLAGIAGLQADVRSNPAQDSRLTIRGFGSRSAFGVRGIRLTLDGIPLTTPDGQSQPSSLLASDLASVEVLKGPFAALYGNAGGGVVAYRSRPPESGKLSLQHQQSPVFSQQSLRLDSAVGTVALQQLHQQGYRPWNSATRQQALWKHQWQLTDDIQWLWRFDYSRDPRLDDPGGLTLAQWQHNPQQTIAQAALFDSHKSGSQRQLASSMQADDWQLTFWQQQRQITQYLTQTGEQISSSGGIVDLSRQFQGVEWQQLGALGQLNWQWSARWQHSDDTRRGYVNQQGQVGALRRDELGSASSRELAVQLSYPLSAQWRLFSGGQLSAQQYRVRDYFIVPGNPDDSGQKSATEPAAAVGVHYQWHPALSWYLATGSGYDSPTLTEMAYQQLGSGPNLALRSARYRQADTGLKWQLTDTEITGLLQLDLFRIQSKDELVIASSSGGRTVYRNAANSRRYGAEFSADLHYQQWQLQYQYNSLNASLQQDNRSQPLPGVADLTHWAALSYRHEALFDSQFMLQWQRNAAVYVSEQQPVQVPAYQLWHASVQWQHRWQAIDWHWFVRLQNLTDEVYAATVVVNQAAGRFVEPGTPRQLSAGFTLSFQVF